MQKYPNGKGSDCKPDNYEFESHLLLQKIDMKIDVEHEEKYVEFLRKRLSSANFKNNVDKNEYMLTKRKYDKAKLKLKMMKEGVWK